MEKQTYERLHRTLLHQPTRRETQLNTMMNDPVGNPLVLQPKLWDRKVMYPRYLFSGGRLLDLRHEFHRWWNDYYAFIGSSVRDVRVRLIPDTQRILQTFFIHKKPDRELLTKLDH